MYNLDDKLKDYFGMTYLYPVTTSSSMALI